MFLGWFVEAADATIAPNPYLNSTTVLFDYNTIGKMFYFYVFLH